MYSDTGVLFYAALHDGDGRRMMTYWRMVSIAQDMESQGERGRKRKRRKRKKKSR